MKWNIIAVIFCIIFAVPELSSKEVGEVSINEEDTMFYVSDEIFYTSFEGTLSTGARYRFRGNDASIFNFNEFVERWSLHQAIELDSIVIAHTPTEAAELGQHYFQTGRPFHEVHTEVFHFIVEVSYCPTTDIWVLILGRYVDDGSPLLPPGRPPVLAIHRTSGRMFIYD